MRIHRCFAPCLVLAVLLQASIAAGSGVPEPLDEARARQIDGLFSFWDRGDRPGAAVAVVQGGEALYMRGFGLASVEQGVPNTPETIFDAGSIAKQFTAFAVHKLAAEGKLSLEHDVRRYIPELPEFNRKITVRYLIHHTSGLRDYWALTDLAGWHPDDARTMEQFFDLLARQTTLNFNPGSGFSYSNSGYILLAEIIERIVGQPFPEWMSENIFKPMGMRGSSVRSAHDDIIVGSADSYAWRGRERGFKRSINVSSVVGSGNLCTTVGDLVIWGENLISGQFGGQSLIDRMRKQGQIPGFGPTGYASGLFIGAHLGYETISHGGASAGYRSHLLIIPEARLVIAILANANNVRPDITAQKVASIILAVPAEANLPRDESVIDTSVDFEHYDAFVGRYELANGLFYDFKEIGDGLILQASGGAPRLLIPEGEAQFSSEEAGVKVAFSNRRKGRFSRIAISVGGRVTRGARVETTRLTDRQARVYAGQYYCDELDATYRLVPDDGKLLIRRSRVEDVPLIAIGKDRFYDEETGGVVIQFKRNRIDGISGFELSTERARRLSFHKQ